MALRLRVFAALSTALAAVVSAQEPFRSGVNFVSVDVLVTTADGTPVVDLTRDDFEVVEDGRRQAIEQFRLLQVNGQEDPRRPLPQAVRSLDEEQALANRDDVRVFVFFLDDYNVDEIRWRGVRDDLIRFVRNDLGPADVVGVMAPWMPVSAIRFTRDHDSIVRALSEFEGRKCDPSRHGLKCQGAYLPPKNAFEEKHAQLEWDAVERIRNEVVLSALQGLAVRLGSLRERRKSVIYVSEGIGRTAADTRLLLRDVYREANRHNVAIYPLHPGRLMANRPGGTLALLAEETGGRRLSNNDVSGFLSDVVRDASAYYLLGYSSSASQNDGKFHAIRVRVTRRGVTVRARPGYWAMSAADATRAAAPSAPVVATPAQQALAALVAANANAYLYRWAGYEKGADGRTRVTVTWEPRETARDREQMASARVGVLVSTEEGQIVSRSDAEPSTSRHTFETTPGRHEVRLTLQAATSRETIDRDLFSIDVPVLSEPGTLSTPRVFRARTANEFRQAAAGAVSPTARREFARSDRLLIRFDTDAADVTAALVNANGRKFADIRIAPSPTGGTHQMDVSLAAFIHGDYVIEITANARSEFIPFRIVG